MTATDPVGVVLAGGAGRRLGGAKPSARLGGRSLVAWVAGALGTVCGEVVVVDDKYAVKISELNPQVG